MGKLLTILGGGENFSPLSIGNLELWLDGADESTKTYSFWNPFYTVSGTQGTTVLTASADASGILDSDMIIRVGASDVYAVDSVSGTTINIKSSLTTDYTDVSMYRKNISAWNDKSPQANNSVQYNETYQPIALSASKNVRFDNDFLDTVNNSNITGNPDFTVCMVHKLNETEGGSYGGWFGWGPATSGEVAFCGRGLNTESKYALGFLGAGNDGGTLDTNLNCLTWLREGGANGGHTGNTLYKNGSELSLGNVMGGTSVNLTATPYKIGRNINGGILNEISEILVFSKKLSDLDRVGVETYLRKKWGV